MDQTAKASEQSQGSETFAADTTDSVTYFAVKEMLFFNPNGWNKLIIVVIRTHSIIIFQPSSYGEFNISVLPACISEMSGGTKESSERPRTNLKSWYLECERSTKALFQKATILLLLLLLFYNSNNNFTIVVPIFYYFSKSGFM